MKADGANAEVEIYPGTHHGFAFPKRPVYDRDAAERHWERLLALYRRNLVSLRHIVCHRHCERSEAIQRTRVAGWIASSLPLLAMTKDR